MMQAVWGGAVVTTIGGKNNFRNPTHAFLMWSA